VTVANEQNLVPFTSEQSHEEAVENGRKGGIASGEARKLRSAVKRVLNMKLPSDKDELIKELEKAGIDATNDNGIAFAMVLKALQGDTSAAGWVRDTVGEKPKDEVALGGEAVVIISGDENIAD
jgi:hypothetical protein